MANQSFLVISSGAENGVRTRDLRLGKPTLYQLSYFRNSTVIHPVISANIVIKIRFASFFSRTSNRHQFLPKQPQRFLQSGTAFRARLLDTIYVLKQQILADTYPLGNL